MIMKILKSKVFSNSIYLYILQIFNTIIPLLTLPYITRILGDTQYGIFSKMLNYVMYFQAVVEYGFNLAGARKVSLCDNEGERNKVFSSIVYCRMILFLLSSSIIAILLWVIAETSTHRLCMLILSMLLIAEVFTQTWFLQGLQYMKAIMLISVITRSLSTLCIFIFVNDVDDLLLYALLYVVTNLLTAFIGTIIVIKKFNARFLKFEMVNIKSSLKDGWPLFTTAFASKICSGFAITVIGLFCSDAIVGGYSAVQKIPYILVMMFAPIGQTVYPYICKLYANNKNYGVKIWKILATSILGICLSGVVIMILMRNIIIRIIYGADYIQYANLIIPLACWMFFSITNNLLGIQVLVARGYQKQYSKCFMLSIFLLIVLNLIMGYLWNAIGVAIATMLGEFVLAIACLVVIVKNNLLKTS